MTWSVTQGIAATPTQATLNSATTTTTVSITPSTAGSFLFITGQLGGDDSVAGVTSVSDSVDGAWTLLQVRSGGTNSDPKNECVYIAYRDNASSTAARTITVTFPAHTDSLFSTISPGEATHSGITFSTDGAAATIGAGGTTAQTSITVTGPTPTLTGDLVIGSGVVGNGSTWTSPNGTGNWSTLYALGPSGAGSDGCSVIQVDASTTQLSTVWSESASSGQYGVAIVQAFKGPAAATGIGTPIGGTSDHPGASPGILTGRYAPFKQGVPAQTPIYPAARGQWWTSTPLHPGQHPGKPFFPNLKQGIPVVASPDVTVALTQAAGTGAVGTIKPTLDTALTEDAATGTAGTITAVPTFALTQVAASGTVGTVVPAHDQALSQDAATGSVGSTAPGISIALSQDAATGSVGTLKLEIAVPLSETFATGAAGTMTASIAGGGDVTVALSQVAATGTVGIFIPSIDLALIQVSATSAVGSVAGSLAALHTRGMPRIHKHRPERFDEELDRRQRLREAIEANFAEPQIQEAIAPYVQRSSKPVSRVNVDWDQIYANLESIEHFLRVFEQTRLEKETSRRNQDDEDDLLELI